MVRPARSRCSLKPSSHALPIWMWCTGIMGPEAGRVGTILEVDLGAIVANWRLLCTLHPAGAIAGVVKANAYGLGARAVAPALYAAGCRHFFVALLEEAL